MKINWKVRLKNKTFLLALFSAVTLLITNIFGAFGIDITVYNDKVDIIFNAVLGILVLTGVVIDPVTQGVSDSKKALEYKELK